MKTQTVKKKIASAQKTKKLTKALENISTVKMSKFLRKVETAKEYELRLSEIVANFTAEEIKATKFAVNKSDKNKTLIIMITSDKGLCGSYNTKVFKKLLDWMKNNNIKEDEVEILNIGKKGAQQALKVDLDISALFLNSDRENAEILTNEIYRLFISKYLSGEYTEINLLFTEYISGAIQETKMLEILPFHKNEDSATNEKYKLIEQDKIKLIEHLISELVKARINKGLIESLTCENIARANSMKNATDSATSLIDDLTLIYNKSRQAAVTQEIMEISNSAELQL